jgi:hypothetical protein
MEFVLSLKIDALNNIDLCQSAGGAMFIPTLGRSVRNSMRRRPT